MKLAIIGSRIFKNMDLFRKETEKILNTNRVSLIISGGAAGADRMAETYASENQIPVKVYLPDWKKYGKTAGLLRNTLIVRDADFILAFWDGKSTGTRDSLLKAKEMNKPMQIVYFD